MRRYKPGCIYVCATERQQNQSTKYSPGHRAHASIFAPERYSVKLDDSGIDGIHSLMSSVRDIMACSE
jgi:hypothetical protein